MEPAPPCTVAVNVTGVDGVILERSEGEVIAMFVVVVSCEESAIVKVSLTVEAL